MAQSSNVLQILHQADFTLPIEIEGNYHNVYVIKRPGVDEFMKRVGELYEVVVFTASVSKVRRAKLSKQYISAPLTRFIVWRSFTRSVGYPQSGPSPIIP